MVRVPTHREPTHPGEMLLEEFLKPMEISQRELADRIHVPYQRVNELINRRRGITPSTAVRLARVFGPDALLLFALRRLRFDAALGRGSAAIGCRVDAVRLPFAEAAIDVDRPSDHALVSRILAARPKTPVANGR